MKILHLSDTHGFHGYINKKQFENIDLIIHSGDESNSRDMYKNKEECLDFLTWYENLKIKNKIFVAGNHSIAIEKGLIKRKDFEDRGIIYLEGEEVIINQLKIWGGPWTPTFGDGWAFNRSREKIYKYWDNIPDDTDIVVTHGPPKGVLDLSYNREGILEFCGDNSLKKRMLLIQPKLCLFGHIHNCDNIINAGYTKLQKYETIFSNGSVVTDGRFGQLLSNGNIFEI